MPRAKRRGGRLGLPQAQGSAGRRTGAMPCKRSRRAPSLHSSVGVDGAECSDVADELVGGCVVSGRRGDVATRRAGDGGRDLGALGGEADARGPDR